MKDVAGKVAFITGGVSGIGFALAKVFVGAGMKVCVTYRRDDHRDEAMAYFGSGPVHPIRLDVTDRQAVRRATAEAERVFGRIHLLCNNAGVNLLGAMDGATYDDWDWIMGVNLSGCINTLVSILPRIRAHGEGGHVVNVGSMSSFIVGPNSGIYATSKFAIRGLSESLRYCLAPHNIGVSLLCPGLTKSRIYEAPLHRPADLADTAFPFDQAALERLKAVHALGMEPDEVARRTLNGILRNEFYIFPHGEFKDEVREASEEVLASFVDERPDPGRASIEAARRRAKQSARKAIEDLR